MKKLLLLFTLISSFAFGQNNSPQYNSTTKETIQYTGVAPKAKVWAATDTASGKSPVFIFKTPRIKIPNVNTTSDTSKFDKVLVSKGDSLILVSKKLVGTGGSSSIDTLKVGRIEQGRGTAPFLLYFNGTAWVKNDTSYVPQTGTNKFSGNLLSNQSFLQVGLGSSNNTLTFADEVFTGIKSASATSETQISAYSTTNGYADISVYNPLGGLYNRRMVITGTGNNTPDQSFRIQNGLLYYFGNYTSQMTDDRTVPDIGKVKQLISDSIGTVQSTTLADGKIWIGDGTNTAFPRTLSGDVTISNLGVTTIANGAVTNAKLANSTISGVSLGSNLNDLTISTGLSLNSGSTYNGSTARTITNNVLTGVSGGQTWVGSTSTNSGVTYKTTTGIGATGADHIFVGGNNGATEFMRILNSGNVGIGTSTPTTRLMVSSGSAQYPTAIYILPSTHVSSRRAGLSVDDWLIMQDRNGDGNKDFSLYQISATQPRVVVSTAGNLGIGNINPASKLSVHGNAAIGATYSGTSTAPVNGMIIEGNVGIGTTTPASKLDVYGGSLGGTAGNTVALSQVGMPTSNVMQLNTTGVRTTTGTTWRQAAIRQQLTVDASNGMSFIQFWGHESVANTGGISFGTTQNSTDAPLGVPERMRITNTGNMGIGTTTPQSRLDVEGGLAVGSTYSGTTAAPPNGAIIEGSLGIGTVTPAAKLEVNGLIKYKTYIVSGLPTCNSGIQDQYATVTDAVAPTYLVTVVGGGAIHAPVFCNGTNWVTH